MGVTSSPLARSRSPCSTRRAAFTNVHADTAHWGQRANTTHCAPLAQPVITPSWNKRREEGGSERGRGQRAGLGEELVGDAHGPLLGYGQRLEHVGYVSAPGVT